MDDLRENWKGLSLLLVGMMALVAYIVLIEAPGTRDRPTPVDYETSTPTQIFVDDKGQHLK